MSGGKAPIWQLLTLGSLRFCEQKLLGTVELEGMIIWRLGRIGIPQADNSFCR